MAPILLSGIYYSPKCLNRRFPRFARERAEAMLLPEIRTECACSQKPLRPQPGQGHASRQ